MPIIKSAKKRMRQNSKRRQRNFRVRARVHEVVRELNDFAKEGKKKEAVEALSSAYKVLDTAVKKGILHKNTVNRRKSSLAKLVDGIKESASKSAAAPKKATEKKVEKAEQPAEEKASE